MATEADISDPISPIKIEVEDREHNSGISKIASEAVEEKIESGLCPPLETKNMQVDIADVHVVNEGIFKATEGDNFFKTPSDIDGKVEKNTEEIELNSIEKINGSQNGEKIEHKTDENDANPVNEPTILDIRKSDDTLTTEATLAQQDSSETSFKGENDSQKEVSESNLNKKLKDVVVKNDISKNVEVLVPEVFEEIEKTPPSETPEKIPAKEDETTISNDTIALVTPEEKEFEEPNVINKREKIDDVISETLPEHATECNCEDVTEENETISKISDRENLALIDLDEKNGEAKVAESEKSGDDLNDTSPLLEEEVKIIKDLEVDNLKDKSEHEEPLELEQSFMRKNESEIKNIEMLVTDASEEIETALPSEIPGKVPAKEDETTITGDTIVLEIPEEKNLAAIEMNEKNEAAKVAVTSKSGDDLNDISPLLEEEVQIINENSNQVRISETKGQDIKVLESEEEGKLSNEVIQMENSLNENTDDQIIKEEEFEEPVITNKKEKIEEDVKTETLTEHATECNFEDITNSAQENETLAKSGKEEELATPEALENKIKNDTEKSEDVSSLISRAPTEKIYEEKMENTEKCVEKADKAPPMVAETISLIEVKPIEKSLEEASTVKPQLPEQEIEKEDLENEKNLDTESESNAQDVYETIRSPNVEDSVANEIEKIIREVPEEVSEVINQGDEEDNNVKIDHCQKIQELPATSSVFLSSEENSENETKSQIEDNKGLEGSDAVSESKDQNIEEIQETKTSESAEKNDEISENNETETLETERRPDFHGSEIAGEISSEEEREKLNPDDKVENEITDEIEATKPDADDFPESIIPEPKIQSVEDIEEIQSIPAEETQSGKENEKLKHVPEMVFDTKPRNIEEVNEISIDTGNSKANEFEELNREVPEEFSEPTNQVVEIMTNDDTVTPTVGTELINSKEIQLNDEPEKDNDSAISAEKIETTEKANISSQENKGIEKIVLEDASNSVSDYLHENEERESESAKVDDEVGETKSTAIISEHKDQVVEDSLNEIAKIEKEVTEELPESINEDVEAGSEVSPDQEIIKLDAEEIQEEKASEESIKSKALYLEEINGFNPTPVVGNNPINDEKEEIETVPESEINCEGVGTNVNDEVEMEKSEKIYKNETQLNEEIADSLATADTESVVQKELEILNFDVTKQDTQNGAKKELDDEKYIAETTGSEATIMGENKIIDDQINAFNTISEIHDSEVDGTKLEEIKTAENIDEENLEAENPEIPAVESESLVHSVEEIHEIDTSPALVNTKISETEKIEKEMPEVKNQVHEAGTSDEITPVQNIENENQVEKVQPSSLVFLSSEESHEREVITIENAEDGNIKKENTETVEKSDSDVVKAEEAKELHVINDSKDNIEEINEIKASLDAEISGAEEIKSVAENISAPRTLNVEESSGFLAVEEVHEIGKTELSDEAAKNAENQKMETKPTSEITENFKMGEDYKEANTVLEEISEIHVNEEREEVDERENEVMNKIDADAEEIQEAKASESVTTFVEEIHEIETTAAVEKTHSEKVEEEAKEALEEIPEIDREIISNQTFIAPVAEIEKNEIAPITASEATSIEENEQSEEAVKDFDISSENKLIRTEEASVEESKFAENENKIEAHESVTAEITDADDVEVENPKALDAESESFNVEEIHEAKENPIVGEDKHEKVENIEIYEIAPTSKSKEEKVEEEVANSSSVFLSSEESPENEATIIKNIEDDNPKLEETIGTLSQFQNFETREMTDAYEVKAEEAEIFDETNTNLAAVISDDMKIEEATKNVAENIEKGVSNSSSIYLSSKESMESETTIKNIEEDLEEIHETETSPAEEIFYEAKIEEANNNVAENIEKEVSNSSSIFLSSKEILENEMLFKNIEEDREEIHETETSPDAEISDEVKIKEETKNVAENIEEEVSSSSSVFISSKESPENEIAIKNTEDDLVEIHETDTSPAVEISDEVKIKEEIKNVTENIKEEVTSSSSIFLSSKESMENETNIENTEDDLEEIHETKISPAEEISDDAKIEEANNNVGENIEEEVSNSSSIFPSILENETTIKNIEDDLEEIHETKSSPTAEISDEIKIEEATNNVTEKILDIQGIDDVPADESSSMSKCPTKNANIGTNIKISSADEPKEAIFSEPITESRALDFEEIQNVTSPTEGKTNTDGEEDETKIVTETTLEPDHEDAADIIARYIFSNQTFLDEKKESVNKNVEETDNIPVEIDKSQVQENEIEKIAHQSIVQSVQEIHDKSINVSDVEEIKSSIYAPEPKNQAVEDVHETEDINEIDQETRGFPEIITKEMIQDAGSVRKEEIPLFQHTEVKKIEEMGFKDQSSEEFHNRKTIIAAEITNEPVFEPNHQGVGEIINKDIDPIDIIQNDIKQQNEPSSALLKDLDQETVVEDGMIKTEGINKNKASSNENVDLSVANTVEKSSSNPVDEKCKEDLDLEFEKIEKDFESESENMHGFEVDPIPEVKDIVDENETRIENTTEAAQEIQEIVSKESLAEQPEKSEAINTPTEPISTVKHTEEEKDGNYVENEPITENEGKEYGNMATEATRSIKKELKVTLENPEDKLGDYNGMDGTEITNINEIEKEKTENDPSDFSSSEEIPDEELSEKSEITVDENKNDFILDRVSIIPSAEEHVELAILPTANNQEAIGDVIEPNEITKEPQEQENIARKEYLDQEKENEIAISSKDFQVIPEDKTAEKQVEFCEEEKLGEKIPETKEKITPNDQTEVSSSDILNKPEDQTNKVTKEQKTEAEEKEKENAIVEEEKTDEDEEDEHKKADSGSDAPVMVEATRDIDIKTPNKKSHNILSGVGSKVKHSIAKVKKAITGKSSHKKEDKKEEAAPLL